MDTALLILGCVFFLLALPVVLELTAFLTANIFFRFLLKRKPKGTPRTIRKIALLVPAHNEEKNIERCVASLLASDAGTYQREVVVIADNCQDKTADLARAAGARVIERFNETVRGKGAALHYAITLLKEEDHDVYIIIDADSVVDPSFVKTMGGHFEGGKEAAQGLYLVLNVDASPKIRLMNLALLSMNVLRPLGRQILGCSVGIFGNGFALTKDLLDRVPYTANSITEDLEYHLKLIESGHRVHFIPEARVLADFPVSQEGTETQRARWEGGRFLIQRKFFLRLLGRVLTGRMAMVEPLLELMSMPLSYEVILLLLLVFIPGQPFFWFGIFGLFILVAQTVGAVWIHGTKKDFKALFEIPAYLFWKVLSLPKILITSRKGAQWVRTKRD